MIDKYVLRRLSQNTDRIQTAQFFSQVSEADWGSPFVLYRVIQRAGEKTPTAGGKLVEKETCVFRFYRSDLDQAGAPDPKINDRIQDENSVLWVVDDVADPELQNQIFVLRCQQFIGAV